MARRYLTRQAETQQKGNMQNVDNRVSAPEERPLSAAEAADLLSVNMKELSNDIGMEDFVIVEREA